MMECKQEVEARDLAISWALTHGLFMVDPLPRTFSPPPPGEDGTFLDKNSVSWTHVPFTLFPSKFPEKLFRKAVNLAPAFGRLVENVARHPTFLSDTLSGIEDGDPFVGNLMNLYQEGLATAHLQWGKEGRWKVRHLSLFPFLSLIFASFLLLFHFS
jgi:hypothetical protein